MKTTTARMCAAFLFLLVSVHCVAEGYKIDWYSVNSGGGNVTGGSHQIGSSTAQSAAGFAANASFFHWIGFWASDVPTPTVVARAASAKLLPDGSFVSLTGKIATSTDADFSGFLYVEDEDKISGIRVAIPAGAVGGLARDRSVVNAIGTVDTLPSGEREVSAPVVVVTAARTDPLGPLGMSV
ncbi:MAG: hypothetical protein Q7T82_04755 [Armatimonadota bacterium]|nr:hypothetical protein [Armatimonadota bacterium]